MLSVEEVLGEIMRAGEGPAGAEALIDGFGTRLKSALKADEVRAVDLYRKGGKANVAEEFVLNTGKPYLDNSLSDYSALPELINYFKGGYRSCMMIPIRSEKAMFGIVTLLSKTDSFFKQEDFTRASFLGGVVSHECASMKEKAQNVSVTRYFDAAFDSVMPQCIIDRKGTIHKREPALRQHR